MLPTRAIGIALLLLLTVPSYAARLDAAAIARLTALGKLWGAVKYAHPASGHGDVDWDAAALRAIERVVANEPFGDATQEMLSALRDPMTRVEEVCTETTLPAVDSTSACRDRHSCLSPARFGRTGAFVAGQTRVSVSTGAGTGAEWLGPGVLFVPAAALRGGDVAALGAAIRDAESIVLDLRAAPGRCDSSLPLLTELEPLLFHGTIVPPAERKLWHFGFYSQHPEDVEIHYRTGFQVVAAAPVAGDRAADPRSLVFVVDARTTLTPKTAALVRARRATLLALGRVPEEAFTSHLTLPLGEGLQAIVRTAEPVTDGRRTGASVVTISAAATEESIRATALQMSIPSKRRAVRPQAAQLPPYRFVYDEPYDADPANPSLPLRVLAAFRFWNVVEYFYAYPEVVAPWEPRLAEAIERLAAAETRRDYELTIHELSIHVPDGHTVVGSETFMTMVGAGRAPFAVLPIEGKPVVVNVFHASATEAGVKAGDELVSIDGRPIGDRIAELKRYISGSRDDMRLHYAIGASPHGPEGSFALFRLRRPDGSEYDARLMRTAANRPARLEKAWKILPDAIAYLHVPSLRVEQIDAFFAEIRGTRGLVLDARGSHDGLIRHFFEKLNRLGNRATSLVAIPEVTGGVRHAQAVPQQFAVLPPVYAEPIVVLHDARTQSAGEHFCLTVEAAAGPTFVGSNTAGANGNATYMMLPGGVWMLFTGASIRHADGRQLQVIGVEPHIRVTPTIGGIAAGRDELLEKAIEVLLAK